MVRFFSGIRGEGGDKKKGSASDRYRRMVLSGKPVIEKTPEEIYQAKIDEKMHKMTEDVLLGRKKNDFQLPGTKPEENTPKVLSQNAKTMLKILAVKKAMKEAKWEKKKLSEMAQKEREKKKAEAYEKAQAEAKAAAEVNKARDEAQRASEAKAAAEQAAQASNYFFGYSNDDNKNG